MIMVGNKVIDFKHFPDGTTLVKYENEESSAFISWYFESNEEIVNLYYLVKHLQANGAGDDIILFMPYLPNARQDRVKNPEDVFTLKYFCELINSLNLRGVMTRDVHSNVAKALLNNYIDLSITKFVEKSIKKCELDKKEDIIFYPDEGAVKRYSEEFNFPYAFGVKERDWATGKIKNLNISGYIPKPATLKREPFFDVLFIDDIIAYGGSLLHSAKALKELGARDIYAFITHVENSILKGELINSGLVKKIYTTKSIFTGTHDLIEVIEV